MRLWLAVMLLALGCASQPEGIAALGSPPPAAAASPSPVSSEKRMVSLVLLSAEAPALKPEQVDAAVKQGIPTAVRMEDFPSKPPGFSRGYDAEGTLLVVNVVPGPYFEDASALEAVKDPRVRKLLEGHRGWISVDVLEAAPSLTEEEKYQRIGRVAAELAGPGTTVLVEPASGQVRAYEPALAEALRGADPRQAFEEEAPAGTSQAGRDDEELLAATAEARRRWPEFVAAFAARKPGEEFSVLAGFSESGRVEHMWVDVESLDGDKAHGKLGTRPVHLQKIRQGDPVDVGLNQMEDWVIASGGRPIAGGFIGKVLKKR